MDSRTRLAISGTATVVASIAVVCAVAMSTTGALADAPGIPIEGAAIAVPAASPSPSPSATATVAPAEPVEPAPTAEPTTPPVTETETVAAPEPRDVAEPSPSSDAATKSDEDRILAEANAARSWDAAYAWAERHGWDSERAAEWVEHLEAMMDEKRASGDYTGKSWAEWKDSQPTEPLPAPSGENTSERDQSGWTFGSKREQSRIPPD